MKHPHQPEHPPPTFLVVRPQCTHASMCTPACSLLPSAPQPAGEERRVTIDADDGIRPGTTPASLAQLKPVFKKGGSTTAGNSSQVCCKWGWDAHWA